MEYQMCSSDWSSDLCSSDLPTLFCSAMSISNGLRANQLPFLAADKGQHFPRAVKLFLIRADDPQIGFACIGVDKGLLGFQPHIRTHRHETRDSKPVSQLQT